MPQTPPPDFELDDNLTPEEQIALCGDYLNLVVNTLYDVLPEQWVNEVYTAIQEGIDQMAEARRQDAQAEERARLEAETQARRRDEANAETVREYLSPRDNLLDKMLGIRKQVSPVVLKAAVAAVEREKAKRFWKANLK